MLQWVQLGADIDGEASGDQSGAAVSMSADGGRAGGRLITNDYTLLINNPAK